MASIVQHGQGQGMVTEDGFTVADVRLAGLHVPDHNGVEGVAGSVTSFVRKLFQMVQGECDSVVGFVSDGTAFEVKDPRRLEQDILPKYFRHSRFQSLVRQLNFYSFKKISKERSVWIYKHAFFRRDEPELLHALKRKTNQHGGRIGDPNADDDMMERPPLVMSPSSLPRGASDLKSGNNPRPRSGPGGPCLAHNQTGFAMHPAQSSFSRQHQPRLPHYTQHPTYHMSSNPRSSERQVVAGTKLQSNSRSGGGPSTGGVGGAAAAPCHGRSSGTGSSPSPSRMPGFGGAWSGESIAGRGGGAAGRPVGTEHSRSSGDYDLNGDHRMHAAARTSSHHSSYHEPSLSQSELQKASFSPYAYRQGSAIGDSPRRGGRGVKRTAASSRNDPSGVASGNSSTADREQAFALYGLSALCQVASATAAAGDVDDCSPALAHNGNNRTSRADADAGSRLTGDGRAARPFFAFEGVGFGNDQKRACTANGGVVPDHRWGYAGDGRGGGGDESSEEDEDDMEDGITSAERDDSVASSLHSRSGSSCGSERSRTNSMYTCNHNSYGLAPASPPDSPTLPSAVPHGRTPNGAVDENLSVKSGTVGGAQSKSGSSDVFCSTRDWGQMANRQAVSAGGLAVPLVHRDFDERGIVDTEVATADDREFNDRHEEDDEQSTGHEDEDGEEQQEDEDVAGREPQKQENKRRDTQADNTSEAAVGLEGIGALFNQFCKSNSVIANKADSIYLATVTNSGDNGLREIAVFCADSAAAAEPDTASPTYLARQVGVFLRNEAAVAQELRVYAEALDPAAADVVGDLARRLTRTQPPTAVESAKLLRIFCRYAACRLGRALEVTSAIAEEGHAKNIPQSTVEVARRVSPRLDECRWRWWRAAVRFS